MNVHLIVLLLVLAAILGDLSNYLIGRLFGRKINFLSLILKYLNKVIWKKLIAFMKSTGARQ